MKVTYKELMDKLGVGRPLGVYDSQPWLAFDLDKGLTCDAEVRCNGDQTEIECEIQFVTQDPVDGQSPVEHICFIKCQQQKKLNNLYTVTSCVIRGEEWAGKLYDWETKACNFFRACVRDVRADKIPDIDAILSAEMKDSSLFGKNGGDGSNKAPKINASQLMYDRKGIGAGF